MKSAIDTRQLWFFIGHGLLVAALLLVPNTLFGLSSNTVVQMVVLAVIECLGLAISLTVSLQVRRLWHTLWGLLVVPVGVWIMVRQGYMAVDGGNLTAKLFWYGLQNTMHLQELFVTTTPYWVWLGMVGVVGIGIVVALWGRASLGKRSIQMGGVLLSASLGLTTIGLIGGVFLLPVAGQELHEDTTSMVEALYASTPISVKATTESRLDNVVVVALESTRADALTPYNSTLQTSPFLKKIADEGVLVERAYTTQPHTSKSLISILCGIPGAVDAVIVEVKTDGIPRPCLPKILAPLGYRSAFFQSAQSEWEEREALVENMGFDHFVSREQLDEKRWSEVNYFGIEERALMKPILDWVDGGSQPFLLSVLTLSSHHNYRVPATFPKEKYVNNIDFNNYLNTIRYVDTFLADLFSEFEERGLLDSTLFVFVSDHGESVSTHGTTGHHNLFEESIHTPLILWGKNLGHSGTVDGLRIQEDIMPTILETLRLQVEGTFFGRSLFQPSNRQSLFTQCFVNKCRGRVTEDEKTIYYPWGEDIQVFDLRVDKKERNNLVDRATPGFIQQYISQADVWQTAVEELYSRD